MQIKVKDPVDRQILTVNPSVLKKDIEKVFKDYITVNDFDSVDDYNRKLKGMISGNSDDIFFVVELLQNTQNYSDDKIEVNLNNITNIIKNVARSNLK